jgi:hypothetical protein
MIQNPAGKMIFGRTEQGHLPAQPASAAPMKKPLTAPKAPPIS